MQSPIRQSEKGGSEIIQSQIRQFPIGNNDRPFKLSWTHYQTLMHMESRDERDFYEHEAMRENWSVKTL